VLATCRAALGTDNLEEVLELALKRIRKQRMKRKPQAPATTLVKMSKEETYVMMIETDLTQQQLSGLRKHLQKMKVIILLIM